MLHRCSRWDKMASKYLQRIWGTCLVLPRNTMFSCSVSRVWLFCDRKDCSPPSPQSVHGIFRLECWSGLAFPYPGDQTRVSYIASGFFTHLAIKKAYQDTITGLLRTTLVLVHSTLTDKLKLKGTFSQKFVIMFLPLPSHNQLQVSVIQYIGSPQYFKEIVPSGLEYSF